MPGDRPPMPAFTPPPPDLVRAFATAIADLPDAEPRKMFGYPALFVGGQLAGGIFQDRVMARLAPEDRARALALPGAEPFAPMAGRPMKEYVQLPREVVADPEQLRAWLARAAGYTLALPPKKTAGKRKKTGG